MKTPRKIFGSTSRLASLAALLLLPAAALRAQDATAEKRVALKAPDGNYVTAAASGGLDLSGKTVVVRTTFALVDSNGGSLDDGDEVKIKYYPGTSAEPGKDKPSFWQEADGKVVRAGKAPSGDAGKFKLKKQDDGFVLQTASGKFVALPKDNGLGLADIVANALVLKIEEQAAAK